jgi:hypothetical protein
MSLRHYGPTSYIYYRKLLGYHTWETAITKNLKVTDT